MITTLRSHWSVGPASTGAPRATRPQTRLARPALLGPRTRRVLPAVCRASEDDVPESTAPSPQEGDEQAELPNDLQIAPEVVERLKTTVFGFDTFFVTGAENYQADGVLFKGNLRGQDPAAAYAKMRARLINELGEQYELFLLEDQKEAPVCVVLPRIAVDGPPAILPEPLVAAIFFAVTLLFVANSSGIPLFANLVGEVDGFDSEAVQAAIPGTLLLMALLFTHEIGHRVAAKEEGIELGPPFFIPAGLGLLGSFGAITRIKSLVPNRTAMLKVGLSGPLYGTIASGAAVLVGFALSLAHVGGIVDVVPSAFNDSLLMGNLGKLLLGDSLLKDQALELNPLLLAGWAGLVANALNCLPVGELDGGRMVLGLYGRRAASRVSTITLLLLGLLGIVDTLDLYWFLLVITLQRGPIVPGQEEISIPSDQDQRNLATAMTFVFPLLMLLPYFGDVTALPEVDPLLSGGGGTFF